MTATGLDLRALEVSDPSVVISLVAVDLGITEHGLGQLAARDLLWAGCLPSLSNWAAGAALTSLNFTSSTWAQGSPIP